MVPAFNILTLEACKVVMTWERTLLCHHSYQVYIFVIFKFIKITAAIFPVYAVFKFNPFMDNVAKH